MTEGGAEPGGVDAEERAEQAEVGGLAEDGHAGETVGRAVGQGADHQGLGLIGCVMAEKEVEDAGVAAGGGEGVVAGVSGAFGEGGSGGQAGQGEDAAGDVQGGEAVGDGLGLGGGFGADAVVHDEGEDGAVAAGWPRWR